MEPSDKADAVSYDDMVDASITLKWLKESLRLAFRGERDIQNTILDRRPFHSDKIRKSEGDEQQTVHGRMAYKGFDAVLGRLLPKVVLIC